MSTNPKVLIVDDDPRMCNSLKALLGNNGCTLETSHSGAEAVQRLMNRAFDLVLLDLYMPDMNGFEVMDFIHDKSPETFVIVITGNSSENATIQAIRKRAYDYIKKPFEPERMIRIVENVLQQQKLIKERNQAAKALAASEQRMKAILRASPVGILLIEDGKIGWANEAVFRMLGDEKDLIGQSAEILYLNEEDCERVERMLYSENIDAWPSMVETTCIGKDGRPFECMLFSCPLDPEDRAKGHIVAVNDVSEYRRLEAQVQRMQKMEAIGGLAGGVAHDLNNILSGLVSYPELLLMQMSPDNPLRNPILTIQKSGEKAAAIVQDLLTLARRGVPTSDVLNINEIILQYLKSPEYRSLQLSHPQVEAACSLSDDLPRILGSAVHLSKAVMNLVVNAAEAMPEGGIIRISTEHRHIQETIKGFEDVMPGRYIVLRISDNGIGICSEDIKKIFEPFYTKKKMGRSGSGLGMAVVWSTVKDLKGYIDVESAEGKGSVFTLYLPETIQKNPSKRPDFSAEEYRGRGESVLVVDDVREQREILCEMLTQMGYAPVSVAGGEEAVEYLKNNRADLVILDMIMDPGMDGLDTYRKIIERNPYQKAIIASGFSETDRIREMLRLGAVDYLKKPFLLKQLGTAVNKAFQKKPSRPDARAC